MTRLPFRRTSRCACVFPAVVVGSLYLLFAGHNQPGGGFVGGLVAGAAIALRYVAGGHRPRSAASSRFRPWTILGAGLAARRRHRARCRCSLGDPVLDVGSAARSTCRCSGTVNVSTDARLRHRRVPRGHRPGAHGVRGVRRRRRRPPSAVRDGRPPVTVAAGRSPPRSCSASAPTSCCSASSAASSSGSALLGHGANVLLRHRRPPRHRRRSSASRRPPTFSDPLPQALVLTAIVITFGVTAFLLALAYRSWLLDPRRRGRGRRRRPRRRSRRRPRQGGRRRGRRGSADRRRDDDSDDERDAPGSSRCRSCCRCSAPALSILAGRCAGGAARHRRWRCSPSTHRHLHRAARRRRPRRPAGRSRPATGRRRSASRSSPTGCRAIMLVVGRAHAARRARLRDRPAGRRAQPRRLPVGLPDPRRRRRRRRSSPATCSTCSSRSR